MERAMNCTEQHPAMLYTGESKIRKVLFNEVTFVIAIVGAVASVILWITGPQTQNDTAIRILQAQVEVQNKTIESITKTQQNDTQEVKGEVSGLRNEVQETREEVIKLQTIIEERIPKKK
jgi:hypothetical protein